MLENKNSTRQTHPLLYGGYMFRSFTGSSSDLLWNQVKCVQAGIYLLFYNLLASLPLLVGVLFVYSSLGSLCLFLLCGDNSLVGGLFYVSVIFAFWSGYL